MTSSESKPEVVALFPRIGREPESQADPTLWEEYGLRVVHLPFNWRGRNYEQELKDAGESIKQLATAGNIVYLLGLSAGAKPARSVMLKYPDLVEAAAYVCGKANPYNRKDPLMVSHPGLLISSNILVGDLRNTESEAHQKTLWLRAENDEVIDHDDVIPSEAEEHVMKLDHHLEGIERALTVDAGVIINFYRRCSGIVAT